MRHLCEPGNDNAETFADGVPREGISKQHVLTRIGTMALIRKKVQEFESKNGEYSMPLNMNEQEIEEEEIVDEEEEEKVENSKENNNENVSNNNNKENGEVKNDKESVLENGKELPTKESTGENKTEEETEQDKDGKELKESVEKKLAENNDDGQMEVDEQAKQQEKEKPSESEKQEQQDELNLESIKKEKIDETPAAKEDDNNQTELNEKENQQQQENIIDKKPSIVKKRLKVPKFMFNITDGGFTELHALWQVEEKSAKKREYEIWHRRHDYWLLAGIVKHGYQRWGDIQTDPMFNIINEPFKMEVNKGNFAEIKSKFIARRFKLLEQALAIEEQLKRANQLNLTQDQNIQALSLNNRFNELECLAESSQYLVKEQMNSNNKHATSVLKNVLNQLDELINEMKLDANRLPQTLGKVQSVSQRLLLSERTILSKLAGQATQMQQAQLLQKQQLAFQQLQQQQLLLAQLQQLKNLTPEQLALIQQQLLSKQI